MYPQKRFLDDFGLANRRTIDYKIRMNPRYYGDVKHDTGEKFDHYNVKCNAVEYVRKTYAAGNANGGGCGDLYIFTELQQLYNPFVSELNASRNLFRKYKLDVCVVVFDRIPKDTFILDIEIDGNNHYKPLQMEKDKLRDMLLKSRYDLHVERVDVSDPAAGFKHITACLCSKTG